jgi:hypothetical protein
MPTSTDRTRIRTLLDGHGRTYAQDAGIRLKNTPQALYQLLVLANLLSARIRAKVAIDSARALTEAGMRSPRRMAEATWQHRVDALGVGHYRRYDERTATQLGGGAQALLETYDGDLRELRRQADGDVGELKRLLRNVTPGLGPTGADIFLREVQAIWPEVAPYFDSKAAQGAERLGLPTSQDKLAGLVRREDYPALAAALVRSALDKRVAEDVQQRTGR